MGNLWFIVTFEKLTVAEEMDEADATMDDLDAAEEVPEEDEVAVTTTAALTVTNNQSP